MSYGIASKELLGKYINQTEALIDEINNSKTTVEVSGTKYYVSENGNDNSDGKTPETAWKTVAKVSGFDGFKSGDGVFFKRGDTFRFEYFEMHSGLTYSAYGEGKKVLLPPLLLSHRAAMRFTTTPPHLKNLYKRERARTSTRPSS